MNLNLYFTECTYFMQQILRCTSMNFKYHYATNVGTGHQGMELQSIHNTLLLIPNPLTSLQQIHNHTAQVNSKLSTE